MTFEDKTRNSNVVLTGVYYRGRKTGVVMDIGHMGQGQRSHGSRSNKGS